MCEISALQLKTKELSAKLVSLCTARGVTFGTAESCTGGLIAASVTDIPGASAAFFGGIVSYDNSVKERLLGVCKQTLEAYGAVSEQTAREMARGAVSALGTELAVSVTGIAGPGGGSPEKPVGLVYIAASSKNGDIACQKNLFEGNRLQIRLQTVVSALEMLIFAVEKG